MFDLEKHASAERIHSEVICLKAVQWLELTLQSGTYCICSRTVCVTERYNYVHLKVSILGTTALSVVCHSAYICRHTLAIFIMWRQVTDEEVWQVIGRCDSMTEGGDGRRFAVA